MDQEAWNELWTEAREMRRIEDDELVWEKKLEERCTNTIDVEIDIDNALGLGRVKISDLRLDKSFGDEGVRYVYTVGQREYGCG